MRPDPRQPITPALFGYHQVDSAPFRKADGSHSATCPPAGLKEAPARIHSQLGSKMFVCKASVYTVSAQPDGAAATPLKYLLPMPEIVPLVEQNASELWRSSHGEAATSCHHWRGKSSRRISVFTTSTMKPV